MLKKNKLRLWLHNAIEFSIPLWCFLGIIFAAMGLQDLPASINVVFHGDVFAHVWALVFAAGCLAVIIGLIFRWRDSPKYLIFEYPGAIVSGIMAMVYGAAIFARFGFDSWLAISFALGIGFYFLFRFLEITLSFREAKHNTKE